MKAGYRLIGITAAKRTTAPEGVGPSRLPVSSISFRASGIGSFEVDGPHNPQGPGDTPSRRRIFICRPDERTSVRRRTTLRATDPERAGAPRLSAAGDRQGRQTLLAFYESGRRDGFEAGIRAALERVLDRSGVSLPD